MQVTDHPAVAMLEQLGGNRFIAMTGAKEFVSADNPQPRLRMRLPKGKFMEISLLPTDEYLMVFYRVKPRALKGRNGFPPPGSPPERVILDRADGVQVSNLRQVFERMTGLRTSL